jgi:AGZA family xanthine/uracil permease-like MFS transporter
VLTFLLVALFDCSGCLIGLSMKAGLIRGVGDDAVPGGVWALIASAVGTMIAAATGCSPIIIAVECTAGILDGGRTGLTAVTAAGMFVLSLFFAPFFGAVPEAASAPVLVLIGSLMMREVGQIDWTQVVAVHPPPLQAPPLCCRDGSQ